MTLLEVQRFLDAEVLVGGDRLNLEVSSAFAADTMSDLLSGGRAGSLLLTSMTSPQVIRTADILEMAAILLVRGKVPSSEVVRLAAELHLPVLATRYVLLEVAGRLYEKGLRGPAEKAGGHSTAD
jgi:predicted transcriptional regulator